MSHEIYHRLAMLARDNMARKVTIKKRDYSLCVTKKRVKQLGKLFPGLFLPSKAFICAQSVRACSSLEGLNIDESTAVAALSEHYGAINESVDGVVLTHAHVETGMMNCTTLTLDDVAGFSKLTTENLNAETFAF